MPQWQLLLAKRVKIASNRDERLVWSGRRTQAYDGRPLQIVTDCKGSMLSFDRSAWYGIFWPNPAVTLEATRGILGSRFEAFCLAGIEPGRFAHFA